MREQLKIYINTVNVSSKFYSYIKRNPTYPNSLINCISRDIKFFTEAKSISIRIVQKLPCTNLTENSMDIKSLKEFLSNQLEILNQIKDPTFISLKEYYLNFRKEISKKFYI